MGELQVDLLGIVPVLLLVAIASSCQPVDPAAAASRPSTSDSLTRALLKDSWR